MKFIETSLPGAYVIEPEPFQDRRGVFTRLFCRRELEKIGLAKDIQQVNHSLTRERGAVRGMHYQRPPRAEVKIVRCLRGAVFDVCVDLRRESPAFLHWHGEVLTGADPRLLFIPEGCAHGFQTLEEDTELLYFHTEFYAPDHEAGLRYDDPALGIRWPLQPTGLSERDQSHPLIGPGFLGV
ncbi:MAG: dTDP-4-dehydrorhamnose 3,5-epimerase [Thermodesulfobacteriota bacterium]